jgi:adenylate cyclase
VQAPLALFVATALHYRAAKQDRLRIRELFGYYLPEAVVERLVREGFHPGQDRESVFGVCLYSDAAQYATLSEGMAPEQLANYMNDYYDVIFEPVRRHGGIVSDVVGDAMMAIWAARSDDHQIRAAACQAALEILDAVKRRNASGEGPLLPTRIGLHCGAMTMAHVGARDHFEYRAVGDIVNTASRLEALNKDLGTSVLVSADTVAGLDNIVSRPLGSRRLAGKQSPIEVHELTGLGNATARPDHADPRCR